MPTRSSRRRKSRQSAAQCNKSLSQQFAEIAPQPNTARASKRKRNNQAVPGSENTVLVLSEERAVVKSENQPGPVCRLPGKMLSTGHNRLSDNTRVLCIDNIVPYWMFPAYANATASMQAYFVESPLGTHQRVSGAYLGAPRGGSRLELLDNTANEFFAMMYPALVTQSWKLSGAVDVRLRGDDALMPNFPYKNTPPARVFVACGQTRWLRVRIGADEAFNVKLCPNYGVAVFPGSQSCTVQILPLHKDDPQDTESIITVLDYDMPSPPGLVGLADKLWGRYY